MATDDEPRKIGQITSAAFSYAIQAPVALGYLKRHYDTPDLDVSVVVDGAATPASLFWPQFAP
jgi:glycine cleavage system aminomethyltransferase T